MDNMNTYTELEKELWEKMDAVINVVGGMDLMQILRNIDDEEFIKSMEHDDLVLGLSGVDEGALDRIERRRENMKELKRIEEKIKTGKEGALKRWIARQEVITQKKIESMLENNQKKCNNWLQIY